MGGSKCANMQYLPNYFQGRVCVCGLPRAPQSGEKGGGRCINSNPVVNINTESKSSADSVDKGYFTVQSNVDKHFCCHLTSVSDFISLHL